MPLPDASARHSTWTRTMPDRSGTGDPPEGCTCLLMWTYHPDDTDSSFPVQTWTVTWSVQMANPDCPHHGDRVRTEDDA